MGYNYRLDGLRSLEAIVAAVKSYREKRTIKIPLAHSNFKN